MEETKIKCTHHETDEEVEETGLLARNEQRTIPEDQRDYEEAQSLCKGVEEVTPNGRSV